jgi:hypothetical protein
MRLLAVSRRSMEAIRRPNRVLEGRRPMEAVLDMLVPFSWRGTVPLGDLGTIYVYQMPATTDLFAWQHFPSCIAAKLGKVAFQTEKGRRKPAAFVFQRTRATVLIESEPLLLIPVLTRFLHANRYPLRLNTLWTRLIRPPASAAGRGRRNRGSRRPGGRRSRVPGAGSRRCARRAAANASPRSVSPTA